MNLMPFVSVLMTAYNREVLIAEAIESVLTSNYPNFELIIVDDRSTDNTLKVIQEYAAKDQRIRYYLNEKNLGDYPNRNKAASYAKGEYIAYLDSDDKMYPDGLGKCIDAMLKFPEAGIGMHWAQSKGEAFKMTGKEAVQSHFFKYPFLIVGPGGTVLKRSAFEAMKGYPEKYGPANDMYFNLKAVCNTDIVLFPFEFFYYRVHEQQEKHNWYGYVYNNYLFLKDALAELPLSLSDDQKKWLDKKNKRRFFITVIRYAFITRNFKNVREAIKKTGFTFKDVFISVFQK
jgi:glycosyltransferase involved in cell wall biosynthesis